MAELKVCPCYDIYPMSIRTVGATTYAMALKDVTKYLLIAGEPDSAFAGTVEEFEGNAYTVCPLTHENLLTLQERFPWTVPATPVGHDVTIGLGERLGLISGAHIKALRGSGAFPILAQQSKRELNLTGRSYRKMLDDVAWQVFAAGYEDGYGADGDHLKTLDEVLSTVADGATMITLDCSEHIVNGAHEMSAEEALARCKELFSADDIAYWFDTYCGKSFTVADGHTVEFDATTFPQLLLTYGDAVFFATDVFHKAIAPCPRTVAFEVSIDETEVDTLPCAHYFVAAELLRRDVRIESMAPRFCGEFQKGIDYIGNLNEFTAEFACHVAVAKHFGYRISVHSGSDKFSVFPIVGKLSGGRFHLKTSGTSWVEAVRVIAMCEPALFRRMLAFSREHYEEARAYYHVSGDLERVPMPDAPADSELPGLLSQVDCRQVMHITYGLLLQAKNADGTSAFRDDIYRALTVHRATLDDVICKHIRRHITDLGLSS